jgi:hypothetical protein
MQCKDIPDRPVLEFLRKFDGTLGATWFVYEPMPDNTVIHAMPAGTPAKLGLAKMRQLLKRGLIEGCGCGCRGDFLLSEKGRVELLNSK